MASYSAGSQNPQHSHTTDSAEGPPQEGVGEDVMRSSGSVDGTEGLAVLEGTHLPR